MDKFLETLKLDSYHLGHIFIICIVTLFVYIWFNRIVSRRIKRNMTKENFDGTNARFIQQMVSITIILVGLSLIIFMIPNLKHIATTILAGAGVMVAVIGFASQQVLSNIISGIMIVATKPYRLKDRIVVRTIEGVVEDITLRHTVIKNYENKRIIIPNAIMSNEVIVNANFEEDICCEWVEMAVSYTADIKKAKFIMKEEIVNHPFFIDHRKPLNKNMKDDIAPIRVISVGEFSITLRAWTWASNPGDAFVMGCDLLESIKERFDKEGIEIPYPYSNVIWKNTRTEE
ncbi:mechanosensitive ion channel family protein [Winogradskyella forsetii]|uniref:mechanosensitive ion channel family protein n=1 Tax=Winogradskyella forsetii TaxID=2686077 RepID=UPI0015BBC641|nr:mechanosensitive ion channel family protein [Winogradskyella forsetii]